MSFITGTGATFAIGTTQAASNQGEFESDSYQTLGELENIGEITRERNPVEFAALDDTRTRVKRGVETVSIAEISYAYDDTDTGQDNLNTAYETASQSDDEFNFRLQLNDAPSGGEPTTIYFRGPVLGVTLMEITNDGVVRKRARIARNSDWIEIAPQASTA